MYLTREQLLRPRPLRTEVITVEGLGTVGVHELTARERESWENECRTDREKKTGTPPGLRLLTWCLRDEDARRVLASEDAIALADMPSSDAAALLAVCYRLNGMMELPEKNAPSANGLPEPSLSGSA